MAREMKDSGVEWAKEIPEHWNLSRIKFVIETRKGGAWGDEPKNTNVSCICLRIADFDYNKLKFSIKNENEYTYRGYRAKTIKQLELKQGDLLIEKSGGGEKTPVGRVVLFDNSFKALFANFMDKLSVNKDIIVPKFLNYWFSSFYQSRINTLYIKQTIGIQNLDLTSMLAKEKVFYPSVNEQQNIANYLDNKCSEIDSLTADIEKQISLLEDYKKSIITEAVTKGLAPNVEMKDSGIEWIGAIPSQWKVEKIKFHLYRNDIKNPGDMEVLSLYREYGVVPKDSRDDNYNVTSLDVTKYKYVKPGNLVINKMKAWQGSLAVSEYEGIVSPAYYVYYFSDSSLVKKYFHYLVRACYKDEFRRLSGGIREGQWDLPSEAFDNTLMIIPSMKEQKEIVSYLDKKCSEIDSLISEKKKQLEKLSSYKQSMIYEYVTGKKEVPTQEIA